MFFFEIPSFFFGLLALAVPVILHLLPRLKPQLMDFSSLKYFKEGYFRMKNRLMFFNMLRLLVRVACISCIVAFFAGPMRKILIAKPALHFHSAPGLRIEPAVILAGGKQKLVVELPASHQMSEVTLSVDGRERFGRAVPQGAGTVEIPFSFKDQGQHELTVAIVSQDGGRQEYTAGCRTTPGWNALFIVDEEQLRKNTVLPSFFSSMEHSMMLSSRAGFDMLERIAPSGYDLVVISDAGRIDLGTYRKLEKYLQEGGSVWLFLPPDLSTDYLNKILFSYSEVNHGFLPGRLLSWNSEDAVLGRTVFSRTISSIGNWQGRFSFKGSFLIDPEPENEILLFSGKGKPLLIKKDFGEGRVYTFLFSWDAAGTGLWETKLIVPFFTDLLIHSCPAEPVKWYSRAANDSLPSVSDQETFSDFSWLLLLFSLLFLFCEGLLASGRPPGLKCSGMVC
ncbi:MAG: BatA domain-containing protein [Candidatus Wallbacteria bacterium]|nr:BatA domain-containing protein [Candidatus Wallbacteria bacterium]